MEDVSSSTSASANKVPRTRRKRVFPPNVVIVEENPVVYKCTKCDKSFKSRANILYHSYCGEEGPRPYACEHCSRSFCSRFHLEYHTRSHTGDAPFSCSECFKCFKTPNKLTRHLEIHKGANRIGVPCDVCEKSFSSTHAMRVHKRVHTGEKPYACKKCHKRFTEKKNLDYHYNSHTGFRNYVCEVCGKTFCSKSTLFNHISMHQITAKNFLCSECPARFLQKRYLQWHMKIHKQRTFICNVCDKVFSRKDNLRRHYVHCHPNCQPDEHVNRSFVEAAVQSSANCNKRDDSLSNDQEQVKDTNQAEQQNETRNDGDGESSDGHQDRENKTQQQTDDQNLNREIINQNVLRTESVIKLVTKTKKVISYPIVDLATKVSAVQRNQPVILDFIDLTTDRRPAQMKPVVMTKTMNTQLINLLTTDSTVRTNPTRPPRKNCQLLTSLLEDGTHSREARREARRDLLSETNFDRRNRSTDDEVQILSVRKAPTNYGHEPGRSMTSANIWDEMMSNEIAVALNPPPEVGLDLAAEADNPGPIDEIVCYNGSDLIQEEIYYNGYNENLGLELEANANNPEPIDEIICYNSSDLIQEEIYYNGYNENLDDNGAEQILHCYYDPASVQQSQCYNDAPESLPLTTALRNLCTERYSNFGTSLLDLSKKGK